MGCNKSPSAFKKGETKMRYWVYDEFDRLFRKFWDQHDAIKFLQPGWRLVVQPKDKPVKPNADTHGEARW